MCKPTLSLDGNSGQVFEPVHWRTDGRPTELFHAKNKGNQRPALYPQIARLYLMAIDPAIAWILQGACHGQHGLRAPAGAARWREQCGGALPAHWRNRSAPAVPVPRALFDDTTHATACPYCWLNIYLPFPLAACVSEVRGAPKEVEDFKKVTSGGIDLKFSLMSLPKLPLAGSEG
jgi:hypothetical protein